MPNRRLLMIGAPLLASLVGAALPARADTWNTSASGFIRTSGTGTKVGVGITGTGGVLNRLDVKGGCAIGSYAGANTAPSNGLLVSGAVGIGTTSVGSDKLVVAGNIKATGTVSADGGIKVKTWTMEVPDYVFDSKRHRLAPLSEVERFVKTHKHLPEIPSAAQMKKQGMDLVEMNLLLLKKVEELTLHAIEQDKKLARLSAQVSR
jgi:hypothetical protein